MLRTIRRRVTPLLVVGLVASLFTLAPSRVAAADSTYEAEGFIVGSNPGSADVGGITELSFLAMCDVPPTQGVDGFVFELPKGFGAGNGTVKAAGDDLTGFYDLDIYFYKDDCSGAGGSLATAAQDESGPIPEGTSWVVVNAWLGADVAVTLKATRPGGSQVLGVRLNPSDRRVTYGDALEITGKVTGCSPGYVDVYAASRDSVLESLGRVQVGADGAYSIEASPEMNTTYFAEVSDAGDCPAMRSKRKKVKVQPDIRIARVKRCEFVSGRVAPNQEGSLVRLQRKKNDSWKTIDRDRLNKRSRFRLTIPTCGGVYRIAWRAAGSGLAKATKRL